MSAPLDQLSELTKHPYWLSYLALTTYLSFVRKKGPALKKCLEGGLYALADLNHVLCKVIRRCRADWRNLKKDAGIEERERPGLIRQTQERALQVASTSVKTS